MDRTEKGRGHGPQWLCRFHQPVEAGRGGHLAHAGRGAHAQPCRPARQPVDAALHRGGLARQHRAVVLRTIAVACGAGPLSPGPPPGMAVGPQGVQPPPPALVTLGGGTNMPRGVHRPGAAGWGGHGSGRHRRSGGGRPGLARPQSPGRPGREARKWCGGGAVERLRLG